MLERNEKSFISDFSMVQTLKIISMVICLLLRRRAGQKSVFEKTDF